MWISNVAARIRVMSNVAAALNNIGSSWAKKNPDLRDRILRALLIVRGNGVMPGFVEHTFFVKGSNPGDIYRVTLPSRKNEKATCNCPDRAAGRASHCKHILAVALLLKVGELPKSAVVGYGLDSNPG